MSGIAWLILLCAVANAAPYPAWLLEPRSLIGRDEARLQVLWEDGRSERRRVADARVAASELRSHPGLEAAYPAFAPVEPPAPPSFDLPPATPSFTPLSTWSLPVPWGLGSLERWPGGRGEGVALTDVEYGYDPLHEDLLASPPRWIAGEAWGDFAAHGNGVLGLLTAGRDGFGLVGGATGSRVGVVHPYLDGEYDLQRAIDLALATLAAGDVLLIEQQLLVEDRLVPVSADPLVARSLRAAVERGVVVVEPAGNGSADLDDPLWEGWFSPGGGGDTGSILVGGVSPDTGLRTPRSNHGTSVRLYGHGEGVAALSSGGAPAELWYPLADPRQAYTSSFGGTSAAAAQVAALCAQIEGVSRALHGESVPPDRLRRWLVATRHAGPAGDTWTPDAEALARAYLLP